MSIKHFLKISGIAIVVSIALFFLLSTLIGIRPYTDFLFLSIGFFIILSAFTFIFGQVASKGQKGGIFIKIVIMNVFTKLIGSFIFVMIYVKMKEPSDTLFLIPFLLTYLVFLVSETYFLNIQARQTKA